MNDGFAGLSANNQLLTAEEQDLFMEVMRWASARQVTPIRTAELLIRVTRAIHLAILHLDQASDICAKHRANLST
jgi:hypothetical protein